MKTIAYYLPQFHRIPENDKWWGEGFTEWVNVKKAVPLFEGHHQPRVPLDNNYYDLSNVDVMRWQSKIAKEHGVYGFCFYHYWFNGKMLLEKPVENFYKDTTIDFHYCISWANEHWTNQWVSDNWNVLIEQNYGHEREWKEHFDYLLKFFNDDRYIKYNGKPVFLIYRPELIDCRKEMLKYWNELAVKHGFPGLCFIFQRVESICNNKKIDFSMFDYCAEYQPPLSIFRESTKTLKFKKLRNIKRRVLLFAEKYLKIDSRKYIIRTKDSKPRLFRYDDIWNDILTSEPLYKKTVPTAFVDWDDTPRRENKGNVIVGASPYKFREYFDKLIKKYKNNETDMLFIFAWNEWAEGGYLEPDTNNGTGYLEMIYKVLKDNNELP